MKEQTVLFTYKHRVHELYFDVQLNDEMEQKEDEKFLEVLEDFEDEFLSEYRLRRIEEMRKALESMYVYRSGL